MGGLLILLSITVTVGVYIVATQPGSHRHPVDDYGLLPVLGIMLVFGAIGFADDYLSAKRGKNLGLRAREKLAAQIIAAGGFMAWVYFNAKPGFTTSLQVSPGGLSSHSPILDLGLLYYPLAAAFIVGLSNATNFTDGLDGLSSGLAIVMSIALGALIWLVRPDLGFYCAAMAGALTGFLWWNAHPARVFMGDTCSLALGATLGAIAILGKQEIGLVVASLVCWAELISVMVQVSVFKWRKRSRGLEFAQSNRVFRRAPLHHHFEEIGWQETQVVTRFWIAGLICAGTALLWWRS
jgi:phospho-N-acetylmuramoyl-pentapeptide-transferase